MARASSVNLPLLLISRHWLMIWLGAVMQQAITWANVGQDLHSHMASLGPNELKHASYYIPYDIVDLITHPCTCINSAKPWESNGPLVTQRDMAFLITRYVFDYMKIMLIRFFRIPRGCIGWFNATSAIVFLPQFLLTHWGRDKVVAILQMIFSGAFSWMKMHAFRSSCHWSLFPSVQLNIPALVQIMAWRRSGDKPLSEPMMVGLLTHTCICVTGPQCVK